ncbi:TorA specific chaperone [Pseudovibrio ascidiaceicola]|uniref:TorA specific chaperone n=1 Tax=Pseudovibrio ascidiaceicola TaxID=285279 RepID=A0A1I3Y3Q6_9HYPH|nr:molecular chaperone TorD family protein [Pseudovibrio ascidiaceicola]SFK25921.1 TorA specific chaperone [Pseudovibrio ascidiaceicola]
MYELSDITTESLLRAAAYRFLAGVFGTEVDTSFLQSATSGELRQLLDELRCENQLKDAVDLLKFNLDQRSHNASAIMDLCVIFSSLFLGAGGRKSAPPYASYYATGKTSLNHPCVVEIEDIYREHQLAPNQGFSEPADHITTMLSFCSELSLLPDKQIELKAFLQTHLKSFSQGFSEDCSTYDSDGFYLACANLLRAQIERDLSTLH